MSPFFAAAHPKPFFFSPLLAGHKTPFLPTLPALTTHRPPPPSPSSAPSFRIHAASSFRFLPSAAPYSRSTTTKIQAGRSKKNKKGSSGGAGRIEGSGDVRREAKARARVRSQRIAENLFYRRNRKSGNNADRFTDEELEMIGLGYDRFVRFFSGPDDPNLRHPHDWYVYGKYGPYNWRGIVVGPPIRGRFSDDRVTLIGEVHSHEEWHRIEQFDMVKDYQRVADLDEDSLRHFWVFVRHPKWRADEQPWQQWTLVAEVAVEAKGNQRLDKWNLMGRLGNNVRAMITQCAAWKRPDIIYVKKPIYQSRFEPQEEFFSMLVPLLDPATEGNHQFDVEIDGRVVRSTYYGVLCRMVKISPKSYVDDVVNAYEKMSDERKSKCLEFLLTNHPLELLHPYTKEWKAKLEEMEMGCDTPDESDDDADVIVHGSENTEWMADEVDEEEEEEEQEEETDDGVIDVGQEYDSQEEEDSPEETEEYWNEQWKKAVASNSEMEKFVERSVKRTTAHYRQQIMEEERLQSMRQQQKHKEAHREEIQTVQQSESEATNAENRSSDERTDKVPPELFLRAGVRPFTYRNLVKEIVLMRHAIVDGDIAAIR